MRVAMLANARSPHTARWASALAGRGHEVHVISIRSAAIDGATTHRVGFGPDSAARLPTLLSYLRLLLSARRLIHRLRPDVINAHYSVTHGSIAAINRLRPLVLTVWGTDVVAGDNPVRGPKAWLNRLLLRRANAVTSSSRFLAGAVDALSGADAGVRVVPFGVDTSRFGPGPGMARADGSFVIGFVKGLEPRYDPFTLIEGFAEVARGIPEARLVVAGGGRLEPEVRRRVDRLGLAARVEFLGRVPHDSVPALMRGFDVLVNCSVSESFGVVVLEASATGIPVVATRVGGIAETIVEGETGLLVPPADPSALARALLLLARDPRRRGEMGRAGREFVRAEYEWEACVDSMLTVFESVAR